MAKIAVDLERALARRRRDEAPGQITPSMLSHGDGWTVADVVCTSGPPDRPFEERHERPTIAIVLAGTFQYRSPLGRELMTPGSLMLGNAGHCYECGHSHAEGDRSVAFWYEPDYFERLAADAGIRRRRGFISAKLPPVAAVSPLVARAAAGAVGSSDVAWEELGVELAMAALAADSGAAFTATDLPPASAAARVTRALRTIERHHDGPMSLRRLARAAGLSPYHFLRTFERLTGNTPHQYVRRARLREAAIRLVDAPARVLDIALDCGFGDISAFNRAFRAEFGVSPTRYRLSA